MTLLERLSDELITAMKRKDVAVVGTLRMLKAQLKNAEISKSGDLSSEEEMAVLRSAAKRRREAIEIYEKSRRADLLDQEKAELKIISSYLPQQLPVEEIEIIVTQVIADVGASTAKDIGRVMARAMQMLKGKADGKSVQKIVSGRLS